jgi:hypothetical protein
LTYASKREFVVAARRTPAAAEYEIFIFGDTGAVFAFGGWPGFGTGALTNLCVVQSSLTKFIVAYKDTVDVRAETWSYNGTTLVAPGASTIVNAISGAATDNLYSVFVHRAGGSVNSSVIYTLFQTNQAADDGTTSVKYTHTKFYHSNDAITVGGVAIHYDLQPDSVPFYWDGAVYMIAQRGANSQRTRGVIQIAKSDADNFEVAGSGNAKLHAWVSQGESGWSPYYLSAATPTCMIGDSVFAALSAPDDPSNEHSAAS